MTLDIFGQDSSLTHADALNDWNAVQLGVLSHSAVSTAFRWSAVTAE